MPVANELRVTSRTPAIKLDAGFMVQASELPDELAGKLLRWGMDNYQDKTPLFSEWLGLSDNDQKTIAPYLDTDELKARRLVVVAFEESAIKAREVSATRAHARSHRQDVAGPEVEREWPDPHGHVAQLKAIGMTATEAVTHLRRWMPTYGTDEINQALARINGRRIDRPGPYLDRILKNGRQHIGQDAPEVGDGKSNASATASAKPVRRRVQVTPNAPWVFVGWTAKNNPRDGGTVETRKQAWRTDAGGLNYMPSDDPSSNPTYEQDAGIYETD
jgi:hypothetical protein